MAVVARGRRLITDLAHAAPDSPPSFAATTALRFFHATSRWNLTASPFGWQIVAVAQPVGATNSGFVRRHS
jgi:hypothetical protein